MNTIYDEVRAEEAWISEKRQHLHAHPELSLKEEKTTEYCQGLLEELGYQVKPSWGYGFTADLVIDPAFKTIAYRADMDALPMTELTDCHFKSTVPGVMHACGHDTHMAIALGTAKMLARKKAQLPCNIRFIFQPSEEQLPGGALGMIEAGCLVGVDEVYGLHNDPGTEVGKLRTRVGPLMAQGDAFSVTVNGVGCHAARPHDGLDPVVAACQLVTNWQSIVSRCINPQRQAVLSVCAIHGGDAFNVIPDQVCLKGTVRTFDTEDQRVIKAQMEDSLLSYRARGYQVDLKYTDGYIPVCNHADCVARLERAAVPYLQAQNVDTNTLPEGWGEDFSYYLAERPGAFYLLGSGNASLKINEPLHSPRFQVDERFLVLGVCIMATIALDFESKTLR